MSITYIKKDENTLTVTEIITETHITEEDRVEIQTQIDHLRLDKSAISEKIDALVAKLAILDEE